MTLLTAQHAKGAGFLAAQMLYQSGIPSIYPAKLYSEVHFGSSPKARRSTLERAVETGWLALTIDGKVRLGEPAIKFFAGESTQAAQYVGTIATSREPLTPLHARPPLSKRFIPSSKGFRDDVPAFSVREGVSFRTVGGSA